MPAAWGRGRGRVDDDDVSPGMPALAAAAAAGSGLDAETLLAEGERIMAEYEERRRRSHG